MTKFIVTSKTLYIVFCKDFVYTSYKNRKKEPLAVTTVLRAGIQLRSIALARVQSLASYTQRILGTGSKCYRPYFWTY